MAFPANFEAKSSFTVWEMISLSLYPGFLCACLRDAAALDSRKM